ncbi:UAA transporter [Lactarius deliciosus]|nr:UAA transporter [Lactarius deliciosus]
MTDWFITLGLVFGGCCSNALTLERVTSEYPRSGSLITFSQFLVISLHGLPKFVTFTRGPFNIPVPRLLPRRIPLTPYLIQVGLFYTISLLNNLAFGYSIPMPVHIIFRSGGLVISMLMGWLISGKSHQTADITTFDSHRYLQGIAILTLALVLSGFLGVVQDKTYALYAKNEPTRLPNTKVVVLPDIWEESMFYLHFLSLPVFFSVRKDLTMQVKELFTSATMLPVPLLAARITLPTVLPTLLANTLTQLSVWQASTASRRRFPALTVTLVVSLVLSVLLFDGANVIWGMLWSGAFLVFTGTVVYTVRREKKE